jgi:glycine dehydrogenase subunit 2
MRHYLLPDISHTGKCGVSLPLSDVPPTPLPPPEMLRQNLDLPEISEVEVVRYFTGLSQLNYGVDGGFYPLGSCTMKYNPKVNEDVAHLSGFTGVHPLQAPQTAQGTLRLMFELQNWLTELTGMAATSLTPMAGAHGELANIFMIKAYFESRGDKKRHIVLVPDSSHGTNPATASMGGYDVAAVPSDKNGNIDLKALKERLTAEVAALTLTMPTTLGLFDPQMEEISRAVHGAGALLCGDGANMNSLIGRVKFSELGFDCVQLNLHKTFSSPHGGGGPGAGPVCVNANLADFLPSPLVVKNGDGYTLADPVHSIGRLGGACGNFGVMVRAYAYIRTLGAEGLKEVSRDAVINANYIKESLKEDFYLPYDRTCMHEVVFSGRKQMVNGVHTIDIAKRLIDYGFYPPTIYFPLIVEEALMIEPTETESKATLDAFITAMKAIAKEAAESPELLHAAPHNAPVKRLDETRAARNPDLGWKMGKSL